MSDPAPNSDVPLAEFTVCQRVNERVDGRVGVQEASQPQVHLLGVTLGANDVNVGVIGGEREPAYDEDCHDTEKHDGRSNVASCLCIRWASLLL